jgi:2-polyprenyl-6-hydroxyphenyl methylase/3-demethylubiquinone-9 3-methyltransferase
VSSAQEFYRNWFQAQAHGAPGGEVEATFFRRVQAALRVMGPCPRRVLDFGCGDGAASKVLAAAGHTVVGVDISESAIAIARQNVPSATFTLIESESHIPFPDASFDACFCTEVIEHVLGVREFIGEVHRLLAPEGLFLITAPYHGCVKNLLIITLNFERHFDVTWGHIRFFTRRSLTQCLEAGGFEVQAFMGIGRFWPVRKTMFITARSRP